MLKLSFAPWGETLAEQLDAARAAEDAGASCVWFAELDRSAFVPAAAACALTRRVKVGTAVALAFVRSPLNVALSALDLEELSGGRFVLGLGSGVERLNRDWHNRSFDHPVARVEQVVGAVRTVFDHLPKDEDFAFAGNLERMDVRGLRRPGAARLRGTPIYLAAVGPKMLELTGRVADGWLSHELGSPEHLAEVVLPGLKRGLRAGGRGVEALEVVASACCCVRRDAAEARRIAAHLVAFYATVKTYEPFFASKGFAQQARAIQAHYRAGALSRAVDCCSDEMVEAFAIAGTPDQVLARLRAYEGLADQVKVSPPTHLLEPEVVREAQQQLMEVLW
jgi:probable F420-dependent oxidoreductase